MGHKVKQSLMSSRIDFFYYAFHNIILASTTVLILAVITLSISYTSAHNNSSDKVSVSVPVSCTLTSHINSGEEHTISMVSGTYEDDIGITTFTTSCNDPNGFVVYANGNTDDAEGNNKLTSILGSTYDIPSGTATSGDTSQWAMKLTAINATTPSDTPTIVPGYDAYSAIPTSWTKVAYKGAGTTNMDIGSSFTTTYAIYLKGTQPASTYSGQVKYIMLHPSTAAEPTDTLEHAFALAGKSKVQVTDPITRQSGSFYKMQDMTTNICESTTLVDEQNTLQLVDTRDNKLYWVTKLQDGHCWMTQNLDLDLTSGIALTSETTDLNDNSLSGAYRLHYSYDSNTKVISWLPQNTTRNYTTSTGTTWTGSHTKAYSLNPGVWYWNTNDNTLNCNYLTTTCEDFAQTPYSNNGAHGAVGNYYNWSAAIASDDSSSLTEGTYDNINNNPHNSICPKGWRLPTVSNQQSSIINSTNEFARLNNLYNEDKTNTDLAWVKAPLWFVRSGYIGYNGLDNIVNSTASYWSSTDYSYNGVYGGAYKLNFSKSGISTANHAAGYFDGKFLGISIRCLAR